MISRSFAWLDDSVERSDADYARATALAKKWSELQAADENRMFRRMADAESGYGDREIGCDDCAICASGDYLNCPQEVAIRERSAALEAERTLELELVEDKLAAIGARMMRPYEHHNEDERYYEYMENRD